MLLCLLLPLLLLLGCRVLLVRLVGALYPPTPASPWVRLLTITRDSLERQNTPPAPGTGG